MIAFGVAAGCGGATVEAVGSGGSGGDARTEAPPAQLRTYRLTCQTNVAVLDMSVELSIELDRPYTEGGSAYVTFSTSLTFEEQTATDLVDAGESVIDIVSVEIATRVSGATPETIGTSLAAAPIDDFDLEADPDGNGIAGPHRFDLDTVSVQTTVAGGAAQVEFDLHFDGISLILGKFNLPEDCFRPSLTGFSVSFPVE